MKKLSSILIITAIAAIIVMFSNVKTFAQPTITFKPSKGTILTEEDVVNTLAEYDLTKPDAFNAIIIETETIGEDAFYEGYNGYGGIISATSESVIKIDEYAFDCCKFLVSIDFPNVTNIGYAAFESCSSLKSIDFPNVTRIALYAFAACESLESIDFPNVTNIRSEYDGGGAFGGCSSLVNVRLGTGFTEPTQISVGSVAFRNVKTTNTHLVLGQYVLPKSDRGNDGRYYWNGYEWKDIEVSNIPENNIYNLTITPNPTKNTSILTMDLDIAGNLTITLNDLLGNEILEIYNDFTDSGTFTKPFSLETLPKGTYFLKINHNGNVRMEKLIKE